MKKYGDLICGIICAIVAAAVFVMSVQIGLKESASIGADFLPKIVSVILFTFSVILAVRGWKTARAGDEPQQEYPSNTRGVLIMLTALVVYAYTFKTVGFILTTIPKNCLLAFILRKNSMDTWSSLKSSKRKVSPSRKPSSALSRGWICCHWIARFSARIWLLKA